MKEILIPGPIVFQKIQNPYEVALPEKAGGKVVTVESVDSQGKTYLQAHSLTHAEVACHLSTLCSEVQQQGSEMTLAMLKGQMYIDYLKKILQQYRQNIEKSLDLIIAQWEEFIKIMDTTTSSSSPMSTQLELIKNTAVNQKKELQDLIQRYRIAMRN